MEILELKVNPECRGLQEN
jgi:hypothetical protein